MEASIESSNAEVCCSEKEFVNSGKKTRSAAAEEGCTNNISLQAADQWGSWFAYFFHHSSLSTSEETSSTFAR